jgi:antitoxin HigA-1
MTRKKLSPIHPGKILKEELLIPFNISPEELAQEIKVSKEQVKWVCEERGDITPDLAVRLALFFNSTPQFWMNMQKSYEEKILSEKTEQLKKQIHPYQRNEQNRIEKI